VFLGTVEVLGLVLEGVLRAEEVVRLVEEVEGVVEVGISAPMSRERCAAECEHGSCSPDERDHCRVAMDRSWTMRSVQSQQ
jgi:hypothetical protein